MKKLTTGIVIVVTALVISGVIVTQMGSARASDDQAGAGPVATAPQTGDEGETKPFIGIVIRTDDAEPGVKVERVLDGGPSDGILEAGDRIVSIGGEPVTTAEAVGDTVRASAPGDELAIQVERDGATLDLTVTVGERPAHRPLVRSRIRSRVHPVHGGPFDLARLLKGHFIRAQIVVDTDDGPKTHEAVRGTVTEVTDSQIVLAPGDDSDPITYEVTDETVVIVRGDVSGLKTNKTALVVASDGKAKLVVQPDDAPFHAGGFFAPSGKRGSFGPGRFFKQRFHGGPRLRELLDDLPFDRTELFERLQQEVEGFRPPIVQ